MNRKKTSVAHKENKCTVVLEVPARFLAMVCAARRQKFEIMLNKRKK